MVTVKVEPPPREWWDMATENDGSSRHGSRRINRGLERRIVPRGRKGSRGSSR